ncbi:Bifunctional polynucleotide phosphatase/kinase [Tetrabaena socialis]|uniref:Bifunctional polynucleotide phosphatase/kinase n=1 Tax=Tetrabaena socialis TaxID=47790 RepID=A0A2J8A479_9CHLO|nr:Bifunctional polynucleotide phosphatase/kinase [Tetrabaena socialis]|eukprot:PNH07342.1 Bifunctional polynucleotide phosphatase/kinase [Tetrabaena socialis]
MPPKRNAAKRKESDFDFGDDSLSEDVPLDDSEDEKPKKKKGPAAGGRAKKVTEAYTDENDWSFQPPSLLYKSYNDPEPNDKIAAFDLDGTLVNTKSGAQFPRDDLDFKWYNKNVADKLQSYHEQGYKIVIFSNQNGIKSAITGKAAEKLKGRVDLIVAELNCPVQVFAATLEDNFRKPASGMWEYFCRNCNGGVRPNLASSFFVGDAAGRPADFASSDKEFAEAIGLPFRVPEDEFGEMEGKRSLPAGLMKQGEGGELVVANPDNAGLVHAFKQVADNAFAEGATEDAGDFLWADVATAPGLRAAADPKAKFKGSANKKVAGVLASYPITITLNNLKEVGKLQGVGKGSIAKIKEFLETGTLAELEGVDDLAGMGRAAPELKSRGADAADKFM